jgi:hypothetical protein
MASEYVCNRQSESDIAVKCDVLLLAATHLFTPFARQGVLIKDHRQTSPISKGSPVVLR